jgi:hypothetical protein
MDGGSIIRFYEVLYNDLTFKQEFVIDLEPGEKIDCYGICHRRKFIVFASSYKSNESLYRI